ncbi:MULTISPECIES: Hsp20/alpha crystallin family protein [unclassified Gordonia (in: high G+C Gram-positive bacteria)]|uniref:Hsp20/alpha crystallin family protein n=1 Tax=unclassified Gordonia (in: high G+C Gram-positive bacteria) TaxID=2657482 RepID=UPI001F0D0CF1|nr:Hsp20/alpha crystallin family protein [Gordonia sp. ABSL49_1]MCH5641042.1 Hsp20/alpha crystallin family protein [Gordonia sp. ABSL49_1]
MLRVDPFAAVDDWAKALLAGGSGTVGRTPRFMPIDVYKVDDHYSLVADLPGADPGSIDLDVDNGVLTLSAHRSAPTDDGVQWLASERFSGTYRRQVTLGDGVDPARISASYDNGVLTVTIPVAEQAKPRKIEIGHAGARQQEIRAATTNSAAG